MTTPAPGPYYETVDELAAAIESGEITRVTITLDGDTVYATADDGTGEAHIVFEQHVTPAVAVALAVLELARG